MFVGSDSSEVLCGRLGRGGMDDDSADPADDDDGGFPVSVVDDQECGLVVPILLEVETGKEVDDDEEVNGVLFVGVGGRCG